MLALMDMEKNDVSEISRMAELIVLASGYGIMNEAIAVLWADSVIEKEDKPPSWAIDLSVSQDVPADLRRLMSSPDCENAVDWFFALLYSLWKEKKIAIHTVRKIGWDAHVKGYLEETEFGADWGCVLEVMCEEYDEGYRSRLEIEKFVEDHLSNYADLGKYMPKWIYQVV